MTSAETVGLITKSSNQILGSLQIFGDWFGKPYDNCHKLVAAEWNSDHLVMKFDGGESLHVWEPDKLSIQKREFRILSATRVLWQWYYYGREKVPNNLYYRNYVVHGSIVDSESNVDWYIPDLKPDLSQPAVLLHG